MKSKINLLKLERLRNADPHIRRLALGEFTDSDFEILQVGGILPLLADEDHAVRLFAIWALGELDRLAALAA
jgi:HEAT repeat protein